MLRPSLLLSLLAGSALLPIACTQNFGLFESTAGSGTGGSASTQAAGQSTGTGLGSGGNGGEPSFTTATTGSLSSGVSSSSSTTGGVTSSSSAGGGATGAGGAGAGGGGPTGEVACNDGNDNDSDNKIDCADPDCTALGYTCTDTPTGWTGPVAFHQQAADTLPSCPGDFPQQAFVGHNSLSSPAFTCNACTCDPLAVNCNAGSAEIFNNTICAGLPAQTLPQSTTACTSLASPAQGAKFQPPAVTAATQCDAKGGGVNGQLPTPTWGTNSIGCMAAGKGKGCGGATTKSCSPALPTGFDKLCVFRTGNQACPTGFPQKLSFFEDFTDTRTCSACACGAPSPAAACAAVTTAFATADCSGVLSLDAANDGNCVSGGGLTANSFKLKSIAPNTPVCAPSGGAPTGSAVADLATAITVCCPN